MQAIEILQREIGDWSVANFGLQETPYLGVYEAGGVVANTPRSAADGHADPTARHGNLVATLGSLAPLMGIVEELGELAEALVGENKAAAEDAVGDILVYLCDYLCREGVAWPGVRPIAPADRQEPTVGITIAVGRLYHTTLKRHQRIRGLHDPATYATARDVAVAVLVWHLEAFARAEFKTNLVTVLNVVWQKVVSKRNWKANAQSGAATETQGGDDSL